MTAMERKVKIEIAYLLIPVIGTWFFLNRVIPNGKTMNEGPNWWTTSNKVPWVIIGLVLYQFSAWLGWYIFYNMYFFGASAI